MGAKGNEDPGQQKGNPSSIFGSTTQDNKMKQPVKARSQAESIIHRLNNLSVLINSSSIDLNIAFHESDGLRAVKEEDGPSSRRNDARANGATKQHMPLKSLSSQSTKRRSILPNERPVAAHDSPKVSVTVTRDGKTSVVTSNGGNTQNSSANVGRDGLLDAFLALFDECCNNKLYKDDPLIQQFVSKYQSYAAHLSRLRVGLNDFECLHMIGRGHFGVVHLVNEKATSQVYALKTLKKDDTLQQKHVAFYEEERDIMAKSVSPWITKLQYAFQDARHLYLVMEYHPGGDLLSLLERQQDPARCIPESWAVFYLAETATALSHLHSMGYVHRDVKPDNLLLDRCGHIKLADFGSSCKLNSRGRATARLPAGTPDYLAPEVLAAVDGDEQGSAYGVSCDFWSLGVVAYEMLFGETPFASDKVIDTYNNIVQHKNKLQVPPAACDVECSSSAQSFIKSLVCDAAIRLDYHAITQHSLFLHTDWNALQQAVPPFIPVLSSPDDVSNFDSFSDTSFSHPDVESFRASDSSSSPGLNRKVPFVGFTYARPPPPAPQNINSSSTRLNSADESMAEAVSKLQTELTEKKREIHELKMKATEGTSTATQELQQVKGKLQQLEHEKTRLQQQLRSKEESLSAVQQQLASERAERSTMESKTLLLIKDIKSKWKREEEERMTQLQEKCELLENVVHKERTEHSETLVKHRESLKEITTLERQVLHYRKVAHNKDKEAKKLDSEVQYLKQQLEQLNSTSSLEDTLKTELNTTEKSLAAVTMQRDELKSKVAELERSCESRSSLEQEMAELKEQLDVMETKAFEEMEKMNKVHDEVLAMKENLVKELQTSLKQEKREKNLMSSKLKTANEQLGETAERLSQFEKELEKMGERKESERDDLQRCLEELRRRTQEQERTIKDLESKEENYKKRIAELKSEQSVLETTLRDQVQSGEERQVAELERVTEQLRTVRESLVREEERHKTAMRDLTQEQEAASRLKLDLKLNSKKLEEAQEKIVFLRECYREAREEGKQKLADLKVKEEEKEKIILEKAKLEDDIKAAEQAAEELKESHKAAIDTLEARIATLEDSLKEKNEINKKLSEARAEIDKSKWSKRGVESKLEQTEQDRMRAEEKAEKLMSNLTELKNKLKASEELNSQLKELCTEQDQQLTQLEVIEEKMQEQNSVKASLEDKISKLEADLKAARVQVNEEKSLKMFQERQVKNLQEQLKNTEEQQEEHFDVLQKDVNSCAKENMKLSERIIELEGQLEKLEAEISAVEDREEALKCEVALLKEETAGHISHIHTLKDSNFQLTQGLEQAIEKGEMYKKKVEELGEELKQEKQVAHDRDHRNKMTLDQQTKLIDFLQTKVDDKMKKKKSLSSKLFGAKDKENSTPGLTPYKTQSQLLQREDHQSDQQRCVLETPRNRTVSVQDCKLLKTPSSNAVPCKTPSRSTGAALKTATTPHRLQTPATDRSGASNKQRIRHNIPHRFERSMIVQGGRCSGCLSSLPRGRFGYRCSHCGLLAHKHCCPGVPATCGLPQALAERFSDISSSGGDSSEEGRVVHEGWVKIPRPSRASWELCFTRLLDSGHLHVFDHEPSEVESAAASLQPRSVLSLIQEGCRVEVISAVPRTEVPATSSVDLPFVLKVEVLKGYQQSCEKVYLMTTNFEQKQKWVAALEQVLYKTPDDLLSNADPGSCIDAQELLTLSSSDGASVQPHSLIYINDKVALLGASEGLFSCTVSNDGTLQKRAKLGTLTAVHQLLDIPSIEHVACIAGPCRRVFLFPYTSLHSAATHCTVDEPSLSHEEVAGINTICCHLLASGITSDGRTFLCAAAEDRICILVWTRGSLELVRQYGTQEACTSCIFTPAALVVAADKLYEIDLHTFTIEEFLDESDTSLAYAIYGTAHMASYPLAILQISESGKYGEFLVCFNEFGLFVDPYGRRSREHDIKFSRIPIDVVYVKGRLFLIHSNSVEVIEIRSDSFTRVTSSEGTDFDASSSLSPSSHCVSRSFVRPQLIGVAPHGAPGVLLTAAVDETSTSTAVGQSWHVLRLTATFPSPDDLTTTSWSSLPSSINAPSTAPAAGKNEDDSVSISSGTYSLSDAEGCVPARGDKRKDPKQVHFATPKRSRKEMNH